LVSASVGTSAPSEASDVVSASPSDAVRSAMLKQRLIHGLRRFPFGEAAEARRPRW
jgi:hypothetical protein